MSRDREKSFSIFFFLLIGLTKYNAYEAEGEKENIERCANISNFIGRYAYVRTHTHVLGERSD